jgi:hypothetical protein
MKCIWTSLLLSPATSATSASPPTAWWSGIKLRPASGQAGTLMAVRLTRGECNFTGSFHLSSTHQERLHEAVLPCTVQILSPEHASTV